MEQRPSRTQCFGVIEVFSDSFAHPFVLDISLVFCKSEPWLTDGAAKVLFGWSFGTPEEIKKSSSCFAVDGSFDDDFSPGAEQCHLFDDLPRA